MPTEMVVYFGDGFWSLLEVAMQMTLVLVTGHVLASTAVFSQMLRRLPGRRRHRQFPGGRG